MTDNTEDMLNQSWTEDESEVFLRQGEVFVPWRQEQISTICSLIPADVRESFSCVELGAGDGALAKSVLESFPNCRYLALEGSEVMEGRLRKQSPSSSGRIEIRRFRLEGQEWRFALPKPLRCVLASLIVHHLDAGGKKKLFADIASQLEPGGAFIMADIVEAATPRIAGLFAHQWYEAVRVQSIEKTGDLRAYEIFKDDGWNYYDESEPDPYEQLPPLHDQLVWLSEAGFKDVGCFWMRAGHAIYGGYL